MISITHLRTMARYNQWQNNSLYGAADGLTDTARREDRGAFFKSIHGTLCHLLWGDSIWMHRFAGTPKPEGGIKETPYFVAEWEALRQRRGETDNTILAWVDGLDPAWIEGDLTWFSGAMGKEMTRPRWLLLTHFFNHQTHHRGQVHAMLTAAGARPQDTDLMLVDVAAHE
jgi:uncharacterized damage-inducible protein DinB